MVLEITVLVVLAVIVIRIVLSAIRIVAIPGVQAIVAIVRILYITYKAVGSLIAVYLGITGRVVLGTGIRVQVIHSAQRNIQNIDVRKVGQQAIHLVRKRHLASISGTSLPVIKILRFVPVHILAAVPVDIRQNVVILHALLLAGRQAVVQLQAVMPTITVVIQQQLSAVMATLRDILPNVVQLQRRLHIAVV